MKTIKLTFAILLLFSIIISCNKEETEVEIPKTGETFGLGSNLKFYFSSPTNTDLLDLNNNVILPVAFEESYEIPNPPTSSNNLRYNYAGGQIRLDSENEKFYWNTLILGKMGYENHQFYIMISENDIDTLDVKFKFTKEIMLGGGEYSAKIEKLYYNGTLILEQNLDNDSEINPSNEKIFIQKINDNTIISFED